MIQSKKWQVPFYVLMSALSLTMIFPFLWMVSTSFKFDTQVFTVPVEWKPDIELYAGLGRRTISSLL